MLEATGPAASTLRTEGLNRARQFNWGAIAEATLDVYRAAAERRRRRR
jgi:hypothetical protein